jgi:hypothetical protein
MDFLADILELEIGDLKISLRPHAIGLGANLTIGDILTSNGYLIQDPFAGTSLKNIFWVDRKRYFIFYKLEDKSKIWKYHTTDQYVFNRLPVNTIILKRVYLPLSDFFPPEIQILKNIRQIFVTSQEFAVIKNDADRALQELYIREEMEYFSNERNFKIKKFLDK